MVFDDINDSIYKALRENFRNSSIHHLGWKKYLLMLDIGIQDISHNYMPLVGRGTYKITNEKKWVLAKLKYGF